MHNIKFNSLDSSLGIQNIMNFNQVNSLPTPQNLATSVLYEAGLEDLYAPKNYGQLIEENLSPNTGDGYILQPHIFSKNIACCIEKMEKNTNKIVQETVQQELKILQENKELLNAYCGLMIGG